MSNEMELLTLYQVQHWEAFKLKVVKHVITQSSHPRPNQSGELQTWLFMLNHQTQNRRDLFMMRVMFASRVDFIAESKCLFICSSDFASQKSSKRERKYFHIKTATKLSLKMRWANNSILSVFMTRRDSPHRINIWFAFDSISFRMCDMFQCCRREENSSNFNYCSYEYRELCTTLTWKVWFAVEIKFCEYLWKYLMRNIATKPHVLS